MYGADQQDSIYLRSRLSMDDQSYRCPKCGDSEAFPTLRHLRDHLDIRHSYQSPWKKKTVVLNGRQSPLSERFKKETEELENQLKMAQEAEQLHKIQWHSSRKSLFNSTDKGLMDDRKYNASMYKSFDMAPLPSPLDIGALGQQSDYYEQQPAPATVSMQDNPVLSPYEEYQARLVRKPDPHTSNMLTKATEQMQSLRQSTNELITEQKAEMDRLKQQLQVKDTQVAKANEELSRLTADSNKLQKELVEVEKKQYAEKGEVEALKDQLKRKDAMIELKQQELTGLTSYLERLSEEQTVAKQQLDDYIRDILDNKHSTQRELLDMKRSVVENTGVVDTPDMTMDIPALIDSLNPSRSTFAQSRPSGLASGTEQSSFFNHPQAHSTPMHTQQFTPGQMQNYSRNQNQNHNYPQKDPQSQIYSQNYPQNFSQNQMYPERLASPQSVQEEEIVLEQQPLNMFSPGEVVPASAKKKLFAKSSDRRGSRHANGSSVLDSGVATSFSSGAQTLDDMTSASAAPRRRLPQPPSSQPPPYQQPNYQQPNGLYQPSDEPSKNGFYQGTNSQEFIPSLDRNGYYQNTSQHNNNPKQTEYHPEQHNNSNYQRNSNANNTNNNHQSHNNPRKTHKSQGTDYSDTRPKESMTQARTRDPSYAEPIRADHSPERAQNPANPELQQSRSGPTWSKSTRNHNNNKKFRSWSYEEEDEYTYSKHPSTSAENGSRYRTEQGYGAGGIRGGGQDNHPKRGYVHRAPLGNAYDDYNDRADYLSQSDDNDSGTLAELSKQLKGNLEFSDTDYEGYMEDEGERIKQRQQEEQSLARRRRKQAALNTSPGSPHRVQYITTPTVLPALSTDEETAMWFCVFLYLDTYELGVAAQVCRAWRDISRHPALWRKVVLEGRRIDSKYFQTISQWCTQLQSLKLNDLYPRPRMDMESQDHYTKSTWGCCEEGLQFLLQVAGQNLRSFALTNCSHILSDRVLWLLSCHCPLVERVAYVSAVDPVGAEVMYAMGAGCRNIHTLIIPPVFPNDKPHKFSDECCMMLARCWSSLLVLNIGGVEVTGKGLTAIARHCPQLQVMELDHMAEIEEATATAMCRVGLKGLTTLDFTFTPPAPKAILQFHSACPLLEAIHVHIGIMDYFDDPSSSHSKREYKTIVEKLQTLKRRPGLGRVLHLRTDYN